MRKEKKNVINRSTVLPVPGTRVHVSLVGGGKESKERIAPHTTYYYRQRRH